VASDVGSDVGAVVVVMVVDGKDEDDGVVVVVVEVVVIVSVVTFSMDDSCVEFDSPSTEEVVGCVVLSSGPGFES